MPDNVSVVIDFSGGSPGAFVTVANLTASTNNASGITASWTLVDRVGANEHSSIISSTTLPLLEPAVCGGTTYSSTSGRALEYDMDLAVSSASSPIYEQIALNFGTNSVTQVSLGVMATFNGATGGEQDIFNIYGPFGAIQYHEFTGGARGVNPHSQIPGGASSVGPYSVIEHGVPYWITMRRNPVDVSCEMVLQDGATGAFLGCARCASDPSFGLNNFTQGDYLIPVGGSMKHSFEVLAFGVLATLPLLPGTFVLPPPAAVWCIDNPSDVSVYFGEAATVLAFGYRIERTDDNGATWDVLESNLEVFAFTLVSPYTDATAVNGVTYRYRVTALLFAYESTTTVSGPIIHGAAVWYDTVDPAITNVTANNNDSALIYSVLITLPRGTVSKLRVYIKSSLYNTVFKIALYSTIDGSLVTNTSGIAPMAMSDFWLELIVPITDIEAGSYRLAWGAQANSNDISYRYQSGFGQTDITVFAFALFPSDPFVSPGGLLNGIEAAGVFLAPSIIETSVSFNGAPIS